MSESTTLKTLGHGGLPDVGQLDLVDGAVEGSVRVGVAAETHAQALKVLHQGAGARVVRASVEGHVLEEMSQTALILRLLEGSGQDLKAEGGPLARFGVGPHHVAQAIFQDAEMGGRIGGEVAALLGERSAPRTEGGKGGEQKEEFSHW